MNFRTEAETGFFLCNGNNLSYRISHPICYEGVKVPGVVLLHGAAAAKGKGKVLFEVFQDFIASYGFSSIAFDTRGAGESEGEYFDSTLQNRLKDATNAYQRIIEHKLTDITRMSLIGVSMGGHVAARFVGEYPLLFLKLVLVNPAAYTTSAEDKRLKPYTEFTNAIREEESWSDSPAFGCLEQFSGRVLLFRSEHDQVVPQGVTERYMQAAAGRIDRLIIPNVPHIFLSGIDGASEAARQFFYREALNFLRS